MNKIFYHGSIKDNLTQLDIISKCNEEPEKKCAYITDNYYYALFYLRNLDINVVTAWVDEDNIVHYEEQFKNQLKVIYNKTQGFVYSCKEKNFTKSKNGIFYSLTPINLDQKLFIKNVYNEITLGINNKKIIVTKFDDASPERLKMLYMAIAQKILQYNFFQNNRNKQKFYKKYYHIAWKLALNLKKSK